MVQQSIIEAARRGDLKAITALLNRDLKPHDVFAKVALKDDRLQILLESPQVPSPNLTTLIQQGLTNLKSPVIRQVKVYGRELGSDRPEWMCEFEIASSASINLTLETKETSLASNPANLDTTSVPVASDEVHQPQQPDRSEMQESIQHFEGSFIPPGYGIKKVPIKISGSGYCQLSNQGLEVKAFKQGRFVGLRYILIGLIGGGIAFGFYLVCFFFLYQVVVIETIGIYFLPTILIASILAGASLRNGDNYQKSKAVEVYFPWDVVKHVELLENSFLLNNRIQKTPSVVLRIKKYRHNKILYNGNLYFKPNTEVEAFLKALKEKGVTVIGMEEETYRNLELKPPRQRMSFAGLVRIIQRQSTSGILLLVVMATVLIGAIPPNPQEFKSEAGAFSVVVPVTLKAEIHSQSLPCFRRNFDFYMFAGNRRNVFYSVNYADLLEESVEQACSNNVTALHNIRDAYIENFQGQLVSSSDIALGTVPGVEFVAYGKIGDMEIQVKQRSYWVGSRLYHVRVLTPRSRFNDKTKEVTRYLNSFKFFSK